MISRLKILLLLFAFIGCRDQGVTPVTSTEPAIETHGPLVPAVVQVFFSEGTTPAQAQKFISDLNLPFKFPPSGSPLYGGVVSLPIGSEDQWVAKLLSYPIVRSAGRIVMVRTPWK